MQTFVPMKSFSSCAYVLDDKRLGKQIIESQQIFKSLSIPSYGWKSHPATKMWRGHRLALIEYTKSMHQEWVARRGKDHGAYTNLMAIRSSHRISKSELSMPEWWGDDNVHVSHQSNLVRKLPEHYREFFPNVRDDLPYFWPVSNNV